MRSYEVRVPEILDGAEEGPSREGSASMDMALRDIEKALPLRVLTEEDRPHWQEWGYVIVPNVVPDDHVERLTSFPWKFQDVDPEVGRKLLGLDPWLA